MLGACLFTIVVLTFVVVGVSYAVNKIMRTGFICPDGHWQSSGNHCKKCGLPVKPYDNPKCVNGHKMEGEEFCSKCGEKIAVREEQSPAQEEEIPAPTTEKTEKNHRVRNRVLAWALAFFFFGGLVWGATYFLQIVPLKAKLEYSDKWQKTYKERLEKEEDKRRSLEHKAYSREEAKKIGEERVAWKIISWHVNEKKTEGVVWIKPVGKVSKFFDDREREIKLRWKGIENWGDMFRWPGNITIDFSYNYEWEETGDYLKPKRIN